MEIGRGTIRVLIIGAGKGGKALLELFSSGHGVQVVGIADTNPQATALTLARNLGIPTSQDAATLIAEGRADLIVDVTGDPAMGRLIAENKPPGAEILGGISALLVWQLAQYERDLRDQLIQAEKLATIGVLASGIAHEINNPLFGITGLSERLEHETRPEVVKEYVHDIMEMSRRIAAIVKDLNAYAHKSSPGDLSDIDVNHIIEEAMKMARRACVLDEVKIQMDFSPLPPIRGNPDELLQVFVNLVTNAVQAMQGEGTLKASTSTVNGSIRATISDSGPGIPPELHGKIFDPFFTTKEQGKGTGLGLHIVRDIINRLGGRVSVASAPGKGASFTLDLPLSTGG